MTEDNKGTPTPSSTVKTETSATNQTPTETKGSETPSPDPAKTEPTDSKLENAEGNSEQTEDSEPAVKTETKDVTFVVAQSLDERRSIPGTSQYLDEVERLNAEIIRAKAEGRKPDLDNPPAFQGTPLYTEAQAKQQGLDTTGEAVQKAELPVVTVVDESGIETYDAFNGAGASVLVNSGTPRG